MTKVKKPLIMLIGAAGSGKGTLAQMLYERYGYERVAPGETVRAKSLEDSPLGRQLKEINEKGGHADDKLVTDLLAECLRAIPADKPLVFDGYPRTVGQYDLIKGLLAASGRGQERVVAVWIKVGLEEAKRRLLNRSQCQVCKTNFSTRELRSCPKCGGPMLIRHDDTPEAIAKRLAFFVGTTMEVIERYKTEGVLFEINGEQAADKVFADLAAAVGLGAAPDGPATGQPHS
ncbi:MAG: nucleoside monophosphate kinase [Parcubacteria group bacterium]|nr:nucleoside monophosphate kinase [Parcubacteria group bacterium]